MKHLHVLRCALLIGLFSAGTALAQMELKFGHVGNPGSLFAKSAEEFAKQANAKLAGKATVVVFGSSQLGGDKELLQKLKLGTVDLALHSDLAPRLRASANGSDPAELDRQQGDEVMAFGERWFVDFVPDERFAEYHALTSFSHLFAGGYAAAYYSYL